MVDTTWERAVGMSNFYEGDIMSKGQGVNVWIRSQKTGEDIYIQSVWIGGNDELVLGDPDSEDEFLLVGAGNALELASAIIEVANEYCDDLSEKLVALGVKK